MVILVFEVLILGNDVVVGNYVDIDMYIVVMEDLFIVGYKGGIFGLRGIVKYFINNWKKYY